MEVLDGKAAGPIDPAYHFLCGVFLLHCPLVPCLTSTKTVFSHFDCSVALNFTHEFGQIFREVLAKF